MIHFLRFRVTNAGPFQSFDLDLASRGLVRMAGKNGSGKSTAFHLLTQNAYATNPNKAKKTELLFSHEDDFMLELTFSKNQSTYIAAQTVKSKTLSPAGKKYGSGVYLFRDGQDISMHKDPDTQNLIKQTLGWTIEEWFGYVYLAQKSTHALIEGTRSERQTYLSALFNLKPLDTLATFYSNRLAETTTELESLSKTRDEYNTKVSLLAGRTAGDLEIRSREANEELEGLTEQLDLLQVKQTRYQRAQALIQELAAFPESREMSEIQELLTNLRALQAEYAAHQQARRNASDKMRALVPVQEVKTPDDFEQVLASSDIEAAELKALQEELNRLGVLEADLQDTPPPRDPVFPEDYEPVLKSPDIAYGATLKTIREIESRPPPPQEERVDPEELEMYRGKILSLTETLAELRAEIRPLEYGGSVCTQCGTTLDCQDRGEKLQDLKEAVKMSQERLKKTQSTLASEEATDKKWREYDAFGPDRSGEVPELKAAAALYEKKRSYLALKAEKESFSLYQGQLKELEQGGPIEKKIQLFKKKLEYKGLVTLQEKRQRYVEAHTALQAEIQKLDERVLTDQTAEITTLQQEMDRATRREQMEKELLGLKGPRDQSAKIQEIKAEQAECQTRLGSIKQETAEVKSLSESIQELQAEIDEGEPLYARQKLYQILKTGYGKAGQLRERQLSRFSKYLEQALLLHTARQLPQHRFKIIVDDGIDILASKNGGALYDVKFFSGGEKGGLSVAFLFALDDLLPPERRTSMKIVDEAESAFDPERRADFIQYTLPALKKRAETVIVISHAPEATGFDVTWEVKDGTITEKVAEHRVFEEAAV